METNNKLEKHKWGTIIIGAGQAGLATGYHLKKMGEDFLIIDATDKVGDLWRKRWDSLRLFTPSQFNGLPGLIFPASKGVFPTKDQVADYLEIYANKFRLPIQMGVKVLRLSKTFNYEIITSIGKLLCDRVVVASGYYASPRIPEFAKKLDKTIKQIHSSHYTNSSSLPDGNILVIGAGSSGVQIAIDVAQTRSTMIAGKFTTKIPDAVFRNFGAPYWWFITNVLTIKTPLGRKARAAFMKGGGAPLINVSPKDVKMAGIEHVPRVTGENNGKPVLEDGRIISPSAIIWCTGFKTDFTWIDHSVTDEKGYPIGEKGISSVLNGLYFVGMLFQFAMNSHLIGGVGKDAAFIANHIHKHSILRRKQIGERVTRITSYL
jgi:putative flavoprotein involved in K+ transport